MPGPRVGRPGRPAAPPKSAMVPLAAQSPLRRLSAGGLRSSLAAESRTRFPLPEPVHWLRCGPRADCAQRCRCSDSALDQAVCVPRTAGCPPAYLSLLWLELAGLRAYMPGAVQRNHLLKMWHQRSGYRWHHNNPPRSTRAPLLRGHVRPLIRCRHVAEKLSITGLKFWQSGGSRLDRPDPSLRTTSSAVCSRHM